MEDELRTRWSLVSCLDPGSGYWQLGCDYRTPPVSGELHVPPVHHHSFCFCFMPRSRMLGRSTLVTSDPSLTVFDAISGLSLTVLVPSGSSFLCACYHCRTLP